MFPVRRYATGVELAPLNAFTLTSAIEDGLGNVTPAAFSGQSSRVVAVNEPRLIVTDSTGSLPAGATRYWRVGVQVALGQVAPAGVQNWPWDGSIEQAVRTNGGASQVLASGPMLRTGAYADSPIPEVGFGPVAIVGYPSSKQHSCLFFGDSIVDTYDHSGDATGHYGWMARGARIANVPHAKASFPGNRAARATPTAAPRQFDLCQYATHVAIHLGINDIAAGTSLATLQADILAIIAGCRAYGCKVYLALIGPRTTSDNGWTTDDLVHQTYATGHEPGGIRDQANAWFASGVCDGIINYLPYVESQTNHGIWQAGKTFDGLHPGAPGVGTVHTAMAQAMVDSIATWT